ncbi:MAG: hypothetical protein SWX82_34130 [Cyanobacteriota bacterium]|nr:hypothetical protein [Cyanobacteriota bacterium]
MESFLGKPELGNLDLPQSFRQRCSEFIDRYHLLIDRIRDINKLTTDSWVPIYYETIPEN